MANETSQSWESIKNPSSKKKVHHRPSSKKKFIGAPDKFVVRVLSANTCGFDAEGMDNLDEMATIHKIDVVLLQESTNSQAVAAIVDPTKWETFTTQKGPYARIFNKQAITPDLAVRRFYTFLKRVDADITLERRPLPPMEQCPHVCEWLGVTPEPAGPPQLSLPPQPSSVRKSERLLSSRKQKLDFAKEKALGTRAPDCMELIAPGYQPVLMLNYHGPQGGGSAKGFSGMDASARLP